jgi:carboxyl-terminal processing protease
VTDEIIAEAAKKDIKPKDEEELQQTLPYLRLQLKALVARDLWETSQYFSIINERNDIVLRALELMNQ